MKKLLIHSNNTSFSRQEIFSLAEQFVFDIDFDKDVDSYIDELLNNSDLQRKLQIIDVLFIKISLSQNYLEYLGIRLAYHIRLTKTLGNKAYLPIVFIAEESIQFLGITYSDPSILFTNGIYFIKERIEDYKKITKWYSSGLIKELENSSTFINTVNILPPANYDSHHSIANEWALVRYTSMFDIDNTSEKYNILKEKVSKLDYIKSLHFKYSEAKSLRQKFRPSKNTSTLPIKGIDHKTIGIIDDEINKGWYSFYDYWLDKSGGKIVACNEFKKDATKTDLIERTKNWIMQMSQRGNPVDIYIVDLRLHDDDFSEVNFENLSGLQIIKFIKNLNAGIQVVVSTASNKVWNFQECMKFGVTEFSSKESPENYSTREETKQSLLHLSKQITKASEESILANLYRVIDGLKKSNVFKNDIDEEEFKNLVFSKNGLLDQIFGLLVLDSENESIINQCILLCFQVLENYCDLSKVASIGKSRDVSSGFIWMKNGDKKDIFIDQHNQYISTWFELIIGKFDFQSDDSNSTPISFKVFNKRETTLSYQKGLDASSLVKIISVLHFRDNITIEEINKIIKLRYYRSNVAAHLTGNIKSDYKLKLAEIVEFIELFSILFS